MEVLIQHLDKLSVLSVITNYFEMTLTRKIAQHGLSIRSLKNSAVVVWKRHVVLVLSLPPPCVESNCVTSSAGDGSPADPASRAHKRKVTGKVSLVSHMRELRQNIVRGEHKERALSPKTKRPGHPLSSGMWNAAVMLPAR